ncbi:hypothetical protein CERZMDRAFT_37330 [Cercospora zeae-maydis SCOH1-5]|uniref:CoA-transferase family III n=1 Tax=Cercospora zeae-maydis SCOH1-5 TaxID=717836 RepID=A0A6A6FMU5_9PEZI|nr:hypothetical protein CERZMDRAFT_37330 [Cercospora zeae-maydis SCOH1-5]
MSSWPHDWEGQPDRSAYTTRDSIDYIWYGLGLPADARDFLEVNLPEEDEKALPSSFKIGHLAQASICLSALSAALFHSQVNQSCEPRRISVPLKHAAVEFRSEHHYLLDGKPRMSSWGPLGGLHKTADGHVRVHDNFLNHRKAACDLLGLDVETVTREEFAQKILQWKALELEKAGMDSGAVIFALRSYQEWEESAPGKHIMKGYSFPVRVHRTGPQVGIPRSVAAHIPRNADRLLRGVRVLELSRVIAAPVAGKTLAAHGADILWVTSPNLPSLPDSDIDVSRGKRTTQLDLDTAEGVKALHALAQGADVFLQSYRPGSLAARGFSARELAESNPGIIYASLSAWDDGYGEGPWSSNRGFDSMVQNASGMNVSEADHFGDPAIPSRVLPVQVLDHAAGYLLATGINAALYRRATEGGSWEVSVSLAGVMKYLRSLEQYAGRDGFECEPLGDILQYLETRETDFGNLSAVKHSASVEGKEPGWDVMPKKLGSDEAKWL